MRQGVPVSRAIESSFSKSASRAVSSVRNASADGPAPDTTAGTPAARSLLTSSCVAGMTGAR